MKKINYHTHTYRCGHGVGSEEDMITAAINMNIEELGICEHIPLPKYRFHLIKSIPYTRSLRSFASLTRSLLLNGPKMRMPYKTMQEHLKAIKDSASKYKDIKIYKGFEAEYLPEYLDYYQQLLNNQDIDYLILGNHFNKHCINSCYYGKKKLNKKELYCYCNDIENAITTNLFSYIAHPDLFMVGYKNFDEDSKTVCRRICEKAKQYNIPLEINAGGIRKGLIDKQGEMLYPYPDKRFWQIASQIGNKVVIGIDAHDPKDFDNNVYDQLIDFSKELNLNVIDSFEFKKGNI